MRDPHPANLLGRGLLDAALEARLVARGIVFAEFVPRANGRGSMVAAALCHPPTYSLVRPTAEYFDPDTGTCLVVDIKAGQVITVYRAGSE